MKKSAPSESKEQVALVNKLRALGCFVFHIPNGGKRSITEAVRMKKEGVVAGVPDLCIVLEGGNVLWVELKKRSGGVVSPEQKEIHARLKELGHKVVVGYGAKDAYEKVLTIWDPNNN